MYVSPEMLTTIGVGVSIIATLAGFAAWMLRRTDAIEDRLDSLRDQLTDKIDGVRRELTEVKVAVARIEGANEATRPRLDLSAVRR